MSKAVSIAKRFASYNVAHQDPNTFRELIEEVKKRHPRKSEFTHAPKFTVVISTTAVITHIEKPPFLHGLDASHTAQAQVQIINSAYIEVEEFED